MFKFWNLMPPPNPSGKRLAQEWYSQGGKPLDDIFDLMTNLLQRVKELEDGRERPR